MAAGDGLTDILGPELAEKVSKAKVLVVGAGGIGCELLKSLVMTGFVDIEVIDLDTIDVSNLNRQFLFQKRHVGMSKAQVAADAVKQFNPRAKVVAHHGDVKTDDFGKSFVGQFDIVLNALDNVGARKHMNRLCLAANKPLVESGTAGYLGQVTVIRKGETECFECHPKPPPKSFPVCTIRNTPSLPIHCIVWAKYLFHQLFGHADDENTVSPNMDDPDAQHDQGANGNGHQEMALRHWAKGEGYDPQAIFNRIFKRDIETLLSMKKLWEKRRAPTALDLPTLPTEAPEGANPAAPQLATQRVWSVRECADVFVDSVRALQERREATGDADVELEWDKDDKDAMDFVAAAANLRAYAFAIPLKSLFDIKSMAGNIIPAIATTNAVIGGLIVMEALNILAGRWDKCKTSYLWRYPNSAHKLLVPAKLHKPNPQCYVCADKPEVTLRVNLDTCTLDMLRDRVLRGKLGMLEPDVMEEREDKDKGKIVRVILSSEEDDNTPEQLAKTLRELGIGETAVLFADDFVQSFRLCINVQHSDAFAEGEDFEVVGHAEPQPEPTPRPRERIKTPAGALEIDGDDDTDKNSRKRPATDDIGADDLAAKRPRAPADDIVIL